MKLPTIAVSLVLALVSQVNAAREPSRVLLASDDRDAVFDRIEAELRLRGYRTERARRAASSQLALTRAAEAARAVVAVNRPGPEPSVYVWAMGQRGARRELELVDRVDGGVGSARELALRVAEVVHGTLAASRVAGLKTAGGHDGVHARFEIDVAGAAALSPSGGMSTVAQVWLSTRWLPRRWLALEMTFQLPVSAALASMLADGSNVEAELWPGLVAGGARFFLRSSGNRLCGSLGLAGGALVLQSRGRTSAILGGVPYAPRTEWVVSGAALARAGLAWRVWRGLRLSADALLGLAVPRVSVAIRQDIIASWGLPFVGLAAGIGVDIP